MRKTSPRRARDCIRLGAQRLKKAGIFCGHGTDNVRDEAAWLVAGALKLSPQETHAWLERPVTAAEQAAIEALIGARIATRKPAAYLLREAWFAGLRFYVDERVLVPRSHLGEFIQERFAPWLEPQQVHGVLDIGTGSGCIALALAYAFPDSRIDATDISDAALAVAAMNVQAHALTDRVRLIRSDLFQALGGRRYDLIVTNPPYVASGEMAALPQEYRHEPALGLAAGADGLDTIVPILAQARAYLNTQGLLIAEVGNSCEALQAQFPQVPFLWLTTTTGDESVFLLTAAQLSAHQALFARHPAASSL